MFRAPSTDDTLMSMTQPGGPDPLGHIGGEQIPGCMRGGTPGIWPDHKMFVMLYYLREAPE